MAEKSRPVDVFAKIGRFWLYLFLFDCAATGSGRYFTIGPLTPRIVLAVLIVLSAAVPFFSDIENQIRRPVNWIVLIFMFYVVFAAFRGQAFGNDQNVLISDIKGFIYMLLIPSVPVLIRDNKHLRRAAMSSLRDALFRQHSASSAMHFFPVLPLISTKASCLNRGRRTGGSSCPPDTIPTVFSAGAASISQRPVFCCSAVSSGPKKHQRHADGALCSFWMPRRSS